MKMNESTWKTWKGVLDRLENPRHSARSLARIQSIYYTY